MVVFIANFDDLAQVDADTGSNRVMNFYSAGENNEADDYVQVRALLGSNDDSLRIFVEQAIDDGNEARAEAAQAYTDGYSLHFEY